MSNAADTPNESTTSHLKEVHIQIDRTPYKVLQSEMTGAELRQIPTPSIGPDRDLFEVVPGAPDRKISDSAVVELHNGQRFFTAPGQINPGALLFAS